MNADVKSTLARVANWPEEDQEELAQVALEIEARRHGVHHATPQELAAIDEALAAVARRDRGGRWRRGGVCKKPAGMKGGYSELPPKELGLFLSDPRTGGGHR